MSNDQVTKVLDNQFHMHAPIKKVDQANRRVSGWASLDNIDQHGDIILAEANRKAFANFRGNIREQHTTLAVGKMVDFKEDVYVDQTTGEAYNGIFVTVYVSKGAESTWEKVLDGTLTGFSIGGSIVDSETKIMKDAGGADAPIRIIKDYALYELSLVDNPANQMANIFAVEKLADGGEKITGIAADTKALTVFFCADDSITKTSTDVEVTCPVCDKGMTNIGWFEYNDDSEKVAKTKDVVAKNSTSTEGGVEQMADEKEAVVETVETETTEETVVEPVEAADVTEEEAATEETEDAEKADEDKVVVEEVEEVKPAEIAKAIDELKALVSGALDENKEQFVKSLGEVTSKVSDIDERLSKSLGDLTTKQSTLEERLNALKDTLSGVEKSVDDLQSASAIKKSGDLGGSAGKGAPKATRWSGAFLGDLND